MTWSKYAVFVWGSYGISFLLLAAEVLMLWTRKRNLARREPVRDVANDSSLNASFQGIQ
jgi:heme exporter protein CcmD